MNELPPRDELASAYLDGEATPDERAAVEADAALLARVEELRAVRRALAVPVPVRSPAEIDAAIGAALAAVPDADDHAGAPAPVPLRAGPRRGRIALAVLGAAAAAAVVVGVVTTLRPSDNSSQSASRAAAPNTSEAAGGGDLAGTTAGAATTSAGAAATVVANAPAVATTVTASAAGGATTAAAGTGLPVLGPIDDADGLRTALGKAPPSGLSAVSASAADSACSVPDAHLAAAVVWQGSVAYVFVDQGNVAHIVSQSTCATLATVPLS